ncbi:MAG TPA: DMT family transporter [Candidatus Binataceae bacterium]|nr:DMT family transporter [Candidatus Binataceae bacterium]
MHASTAHRRGVGLAMAIVTTIVAALQPVALRYGALKTDPLIFATIAVGAAAVVAASVLGYTGEIKVLMRRDYAPRLFVVSMTGTLATALLLIYGLRRIDAIAGVLLLESEPIYSLVLAMLFLRERPSGRQIFATATILGGIGSVFGASRVFSPFYAAAMVILTPLFWQSSHVLALRLMPPLRPLCMAGARYIYSALVLFVIVLVAHRGAFTQSVEVEVLLAGSFTGAVVYFIGSLSWYGAISRLSLAWTTALVIPGVPLLSMGFAIIFLGERPGPREVAGVLIAIAGVALLVTGIDASRVSPFEAAEATHQPLA